jgi:hypothetical protein
MSEASIRRDVIAWRIDQIIQRVAFVAVTAMLACLLIANGIYGIFNGNVWIMPYAEGFSWTFVPALKASVPDAYWYHYFGLSGLVLVFFDPVYARAYNQTLNTLTFFMVYVFAFAVLLAHAIGAKNEWIEHRKFRLAAITGVLSGLLFFDMSMWGWLTLFTLAVICVRLRITDALQALAVTFVVGGITGALALCAAYAGDLNAALFAAAAHIRGFIGGTGHGDAGFHDHFFGLFLSRQSNLFTEHVLIAGAAVVLAISAAHSVFGHLWRQALIFDAVFILSAAAFWHVLNVHPSQTVAEAAGLCAATYLFFRPALQIVCASSRADRIWSTTMTVPAAAVIAIFWVAFAPLAGYANLNSAQRMEGQIVRSADAFFNDCAEQYTVVYSVELYSLNTIVYALKNAVGVFFSGAMSWDLPAAALEQAYDQRMPRYGFYFPGTIVEIGPRCRMGETISYPSVTMVVGPITECARLYLANRELFFNYAPAEPSTHTRSTTLYYVLPKAVGSSAFDEASNRATWNSFGEKTCAALTATRSAQGLRSLGWEAVSIDPKRMLDRLTANHTKVITAPLTEGRPAIIVKISGVWDTRYLLLVSPHMKDRQ